MLFNILEITSLFPTYIQQNIYFIRWYARFLFSKCLPHLKERERKKKSLCDKSSKPAPHFLVNHCSFLQFPSPLICFHKLVGYILEEDVQKVTSPDTQSPVPNKSFIDVQPELQGNQMLYKRFAFVFCFAFFRI